MGKVINLLLLSFIQYIDCNAVDSGLTSTTNKKETVDTVEEENIEEGDELITSDLF